MIQVVTAPLTTQLTTVAAVLADLGIAAEPRMGGLINQASAACVGYCGRSFARGTWTESFTQEGNVLALSRCPVQSIVALARYGTAQDLTSWLFDPDSGLVYPAQGWDGDGWGFKWSDPPTLNRIATTVTYVGGYLLPNDVGRDLPDDVERAAIEATKALWFATGAGRARDPAIRSESIEGIGMTQYRDPVPGSFGLPMMAADLLRPYRRYG